MLLIYIVFVLERYALVLQQRLDLAEVLGVVVRGIVLHVLQAVVVALKPVLFVVRQKKVIHLLLYFLGRQWIKRDSDHFGPELAHFGMHLNARPRHYRINLLILLFQNLFEPNVCALGEEGIRHLPFLHLILIHFNKLILINFI